MLVSPNPRTGVWRTIHVDGFNALNGVSCPPGPECFAVDQTGHLLSSSDPSGGAGAWYAAVIDPSTSLLDISCPSTSLCVATDSAGGILSSTNPGRGLWSRAEIGTNLTQVDCPATDLCLAADAQNHLYTSSNPTGGASAWTETTLPADKDVISSIACASASLCVVGDSHGDVLTSTNPDGGAGAWNETDVESQLSQQSGQFTDTSAMIGTSCPATNLCIAMDYDGGIYSSADPTGGLSSWTQQEPELAGRGLAFESSLLCPSTSLCIAISPSASLDISTDPTGGPDAWTTGGIPEGGSTTGLSCHPQTTYCVAVDNHGGIATSQ
jgi:hypothetical protein